MTFKKSGHDRSVLSIAIAGAGLLGRLLAWQLSRAGHRVDVFDPATDAQARHDGRGAAAFTAAGMLSPLAESEHGGPAVRRLGERSLPRWRRIAAALSSEPDTLVRQRGSLLLAHAPDGAQAQRLLGALGTEAPAPLSRADLDALEPGAAPAFAPGLRAWLLAREGQVQPAALLQALQQQAPAACWHWGRRVTEVEPGRLRLEDGTLHDCDLAVDVRGLGARPPLPLRGVRGELLWLHAPGLRVTRPCRLLHPRHPVYLVPRPNDILVLGASEVESEDRSPVSLRSAVELMAAAHSALPALAEARIVHLETNLRPALPDNQPRTEHAPGLLRINGLYRHGWLIAPALVDDALAHLGLLASENLEENADD
jgi:glycine oxidase